MRLQGIDSHNPVEGAGNLWTWLTIARLWMTGSAAATPRSPTLVGSQRFDRKEVVDAQRVPEILQGVVGYEMGAQIALKVNGRSSCVMRSVESNWHQERLSRRRTRRTRVGESAGNVS